MKLKASFEKKVFIFKQPSGTSRGTLTEKKSWFLSVWNEEKPEIKGIGECSIIPKLSPDYVDDKSYESRLQKVVDNIDYYANFIVQLWRFPSVRFGLEMALLDLKNGGNARFFRNNFTLRNTPLPINGLIWMGEPEFMQQQINEKLKQGFSCIKLKIGAIDFNQELEILQQLRVKRLFSDLQIRVDANGAFAPDEAEEKLKILSNLQLHSIEQPIQKGQIREMRKLSETELVPIALDEELIGIYEYEKKKELLTAIKPHYIVLKPSLLGGFEETNEWIKLAGQQNIPWWITSALESNVGLNAIAQYAGMFAINRAQGLGTGNLYEKNTESYLSLNGDKLNYSGLDFNTLNLSTTSQLPATLKT